MKRTPSDYSTDGKWWWDGEQWQPVVGRPPETGGPQRSEGEAGTRRVLRITIAVFIVAALIALATALWPPGTRLRLPSLPQGAPSQNPRGATPPASPSGSPSQRQQAQRYRQVAAAGAQQLTERVDAVTSGCTTPANLAVCRAALVSLREAELGYAAQLNRVGAPACMGPADGQLRQALDLFDRGAQQAVTGIDLQDPGQIVASLQVIQEANQHLSLARQQVDAASC